MSKELVPLRPQIVVKKPAWHALEPIHRRCLESACASNGRRVPDCIRSARHILEYADRRYPDE